jgi:DNA topoisomerase IB
VLFSKFFETVFLLNIPPAYKNVYVILRSDYFGEIIPNNG